MVNIVFSEFYKILRSKVFIVVSAILLFMFIMPLVSIIYQGEEYSQLTTGFSIYQESYGAKFIYYIILIFVTSLITAEYTNGTVRQMTCRGISRWKLVFGQYIAIYFTITLILFSFAILNLLSWTMINQLGSVDLIAFLSMNIGVLSMVWGIVGIGTFLSYLFKSGVVTTTLSVMIALFGDYFGQFLKLITDNDIFIKYSLSNMHRIVTDLTSSSEDIFKCSIVFLILGIITIIGSAILFSKRDVD